MSLDLRPPKSGGRTPSGVNHPVLVAEIGDAVGGELGLFAADHPVEMGAGHQHRARQGERGDPLADGGADGAGEVAMAPAGDGAIVGIEAALRIGGCEGKQQPAEIATSISDRRPPGGSSARPFAASLKSSSISMSPGP